MKGTDLTQGNILQQISRLSLPIMATSFIQISYHLMDLFWLGRGSTDWVASAGMAGYAMWIANALSLLTRIGSEIGVGQALGARDEEGVKRWIDSAFVLSIATSLVYGLAIFTFSESIVGFFRISDPIVNADGVVYLRVIAAGMLFTFLNPLIVGILNGAGDSRTSFFVNAIGLVVNMILDPILIFSAGLGVMGAALATVIAQGMITLVFVGFVMKRHSVFHKMDRFRHAGLPTMRRIARMGLPASLQSIFFALVSALISRFVAFYGASPFAAYGIGVQVESLGWLTLLGLSSALMAFTAQNFGAGRLDRVWQGFKKGTLVGVSVAFVAMVILVQFAEPLMGIFVGADAEALQAGRVYLIVAGLSQIPMSLEIIASGVFQGTGNTVYPSALGIAGNALRIPLALLLEPIFGLTGIFMAIAISASLKGLVLYPWFVHFYRTRLQLENGQVRE